MSSDSPKPAAPATMTPDLVVVVAFTTLVMTLASMAILWIPAIAPAVAESVGVSSSLVGYQFTLAYMGAMTASLVSGGFVQRYGAWRTSQASLAALALGHLIMMTGYLPVMVLGSVVIGFGYGTMNPPAIDLLNRVVSPGNRNLVLSIRFTGVPLGGVLASLIAPSLALEVGWRGTMLVVGCVGLALFLAMQPLRARFDFSRDPASPILRSPFEGLALVLRDPPLRYLALAGLCFAGVQLSLMSFTVTLLVEEVNWTLVTAGIALSCVQVAGFIGRLGWGWIADRTRTGGAVLILIGIWMSLAAAAAAGLNQAWPALLVYGFFFVFGLAAVGWNGVFASEAARLSPPSRIGHATGGVLFVTFAGVLAGPVVFSTVYRFTGAYSATFMATAVLGIVGVAMVAAARRTRGKGSLAGTPSSERCSQ